MAFRLWFRVVYLLCSPAGGSTLGLSSLPYHTELTTAVTDDGVTVTVTERMISITHVAKVQGALTKSRRPHRPPTDPEPMSCTTTGTRCTTQSIM